MGADLPPSLVPRWHHKVLHAANLALTSRSSVQPIDLKTVLLCRVFFLNDDKSRYVSVGFYPAHNLQPLVDFGGTRLLPLILTSEYDNIVAERLPGLFETMCRNENFQWGSEDKVFRMNSTES